MAEVQAWREMRTEVEAMGQITQDFVSHGVYTEFYSAVEASEDFEKRSALT